jgi:hypothetical protein
MVYAVKNYQILSKDEGWGVIAMILLFAFCILFFLVDLFLQKILRSRLFLNIIEVVIVVAFTVFYVTA